jgi:uncharacterized membrane protein
MTKSRIEAFSDGVFAIILTIMVLELKVPHGHDWAALWPQWPVFLSYILSFVHVGIYWNNHHHMFHAVKHIGGWVLWANLHFLFWLSLLPFSTAFMGENSFAAVPVMVYAINLCLCGLAYMLLVIALAVKHGMESDFTNSLKHSPKEQGSLIVYLISIGLAPWFPWLSLVLIAIVALTWIVPDRRFTTTTPRPHRP